MKKMVGLALLGALAAGCASEEEPADKAGEQSRQVVVFAAASLQESFEAIGTEVEADHPELLVTFSFGGSSALAPQIVSGAPADVFAAASPATMQQVVDKDAAAGEPVLFARNRLQIAVPPDNPADVDSLDDLADPDLKLARCAAEVPCGDAAERALAAASVEVEADTLEEDVKGVLSKVELGEVDAGLVYRTDVQAANGKVKGIDFPESGKAVNDYLIAPIADAPEPDGAAIFVEFVRSERGRKILSDAGFDVP
ncbi:MAG: molybdate ABC transporter substrate-binding protein [Propionibacteriales bacterium]|nr:molybdate ABC transporter substrate-binding protein [Propionibacteriales bacterium]